MYAVYRVAFFKRFGYGENTQVGRVGQCVVQVVEFHVVIADEAVHALSDHAQTFLHDFLEALTDRHDLADRLHARTDQTAYTDELGQVPTRDLHDHVVYFRCFIGGVGGSHFADFVKAVTQRQLGCYECQRITARFGGKCGRTAQAGVYFDHAVVTSLGVECVLDVTFADDT